MSPSRRTRKTALSALMLFGVGTIGLAGTVFRPAPDPAFLPPMAAVETTAGRPIWVQTREVTVAEWNRCHADGGCALNLRPPRGAAEGEDWPATGLSYADVSEYLVWINARAHHRFRLPKAEEWERIAAPVMPEKPDPIFTDPNLTWASTYLTENLVDRRLRPSRSWSATEEGVWDLDGNVWEWTQDCYKGLVGDDGDITACPAFVVGGEHEAVIPYLVRDPARGGCAVGAPPPHLGMRLVSDAPVKG